MDNCKFLCGRCNNGYKTKSSLRRHINSVHNNRRFTCGYCQKEYVRKVDFIKHITKYDQPLILKQSHDNIDMEKPTVHAQSQASTSNSTNHSLSKTTAILNGEVDWHKILQQDMELSSDEEDPTVKISIGTTTDVQIKPDKTTGCNISPILGLEPAEVVTTHNLPKEAKQIMKVKLKPSSQIGCVPITVNKNSHTQTEDSTCELCTHEEHLIIQRQNYITTDAIKNTSGKFVQPTN